MAKAKTLTAKQALFVKHFVISLNATDAAVKAGYSELSAAKIGSDNLARPHVKQAITEAQAERLANLDIDANYVLKRLIEVDALDVIDILDHNNNIKPVAEWPKEWRQNISSIDVAENTSGTIVKLKFPDKVKNLELIGRHINVAAWTTNQTIDLNANIKAEVSTISDLMDELGDET